MRPYLPAEGALNLFPARLPPVAVLFNEELDYDNEDEKDPGGSVTVYGALNPKTENAWGP